jgi:hypothetical protein
MKVDQETFVEKVRYGDHAFVTCKILCVTRSVTQVGYEPAV